MNKLEQLLTKLKRANIHCAIISDPVSINYLTGFNNDPHERHQFLLVFSERDPILFLPSLDMEKAKKQLSFPVFAYQDSENPWEKLKNLLPKSIGNCIALEYQHLNLTRFYGLQSIFSGSFQDLTPYLQEMRLIKTSDEYQKMMIAGQWADKALEIGFEAIASMPTESDLVAHIEYQLKKQGISKMSFDTMVLSGANAANPHGFPDTNPLENHALLLFDLGVEKNGYTSDVTRTVAIGKPSRFKEDIYQICLEAQLEAQNFVKPGVTASQIDNVARSVIEKAGYGDYFTHRLGHGLGVSVHEYPSIMAGNDLIIQEGMCFSIEPGIYIPNQVGVRIEDCGYVTKTGFDSFTKTSKELLYFSI